MLNGEERRRLAAQYSDEPSRPLVAVLKCAAGIATLVAVAAGPWLVLSADGGGAVSEVRERPRSALPDAVAESRRVFEDRRQRAAGPQENDKAALAR